MQNAAKAAFLAKLLKSGNKNILLLTAAASEDTLYCDLSFFTPKVLELLPQESQLSFDILGSRLQTLHTLAQNPKPHLVLSTLSAVFQKTTAPKKLCQETLTWKIGDLVPFQILPGLLTSMGYRRDIVVSDKGTFALRGGIIDIFSTNSAAPCRIEFFGDEIESIRSFDPSSQKSFAKIDQAAIYPAIEEQEADFFEYMKDCIIVFDDLVSIEDAYVKLNIPGLDITFANFPKIFFSKDTIETLGEVVIDNEKITFPLCHKEFSARRQKNPYQELGDFLPEGMQTIFLYESDHEKILLEEKYGHPQGSDYQKGYLSSGLIMPQEHIVYVPAAVATSRPKLRRQKWRDSAHVPEEAFHELEIGDTVVHFHSGIGKYLGIEKLKSCHGEISEFLTLEYAQNSKMYVPIAQAHLVSRYIGAREEKPQLSTLGSKKWLTIKARAQQQITGYASDLLRMQAEREVHGGFAFLPDSEDMRLFEQDFPYDPTPDQLLAITAIKEDMISEKPMDRLVCGDVGYGKTEVAMRAAFKAVADGKKQVAILAPTTVLAMQHYESFMQRMRDFPINIAALSRFKTAKENKITLEKTARGEIDILIGTHRLLSFDVGFVNLGLIIIDEEQRFGVRAKEHLKKVKQGVDCLAMSATPIPRTLYMSLIHLKSMSMINSPPQDRLPPKTFLIEHDDQIIKEALLRELSRGGQAFFIHNRTETIHKKAELLQTLVPSARIAVVHGQMPPDRIDAIFHDFKEHRSDILVATTIVENGIDIPNANTILIDRADAFGLADLYQLRGRVGRWNRTSFAYLITPANRELSEISQKRLSVLLEAGGYGSGIKIAQRDLEIRGAGDILGVQQSGQVSSIGFHLYCKMLRKTILSLKEKKPAILTETKMEFSFPAFLPESYIPETSLRMEIYHKLGDAASEKEIETVFLELKDRFGSPPQEANWLYSLTRIRLTATQKGYSLLKFQKHTVIMEQGGKKTTHLLPRIESPQDLEKLVLPFL